MISKEQYDKIQQHREALELFEKQGQWVGGDEVFNIHSNITGQPATSCGSCKGQKLIELLIFVRLYEKGNM